MTEQRLLQLRNSLEDTLKNIDKVLQSKLPYPVLTQFDEGAYTDGFEHKDIVEVQSKIEEQEGVLLINFYSEKL